MNDKKEKQWRNPQKDDRKESFDDYRELLKEWLEDGKKKKQKEIDAETNK